MLAAGVNARAIRGYEFASDRYLAGRVLSDRMLQIASEVTARLVGASKVQALTGGLQVIEGVVRSAKWVDTTVGYREISTLKMTVEMDGGQRVYGTVPAAILDALTGGVISGGGRRAGRAVEGPAGGVHGDCRGVGQRPGVRFLLAAVEGVAGRAGRGVTWERGPIVPAPSCQA